jgi:hypothetical protein
VPLQGQSHCPLLIIEGDGAGRWHVADLIDALIWVQSDQRETGQRSLARAGKPDPVDLANMAADGSLFDESGLLAEEIPFNAAQRTWELADIIVCGTPELPCHPVTEMRSSPRSVVHIWAPRLPAASGFFKPMSRWPV